ncbi:zinc carboxypeptidase-like [Drosophila madeirensis]|uniref:Zinc carboxypeptidase-like n=1 Tax=Drosophila madeirensis TaxID=30013 RepID=A0AAU9FQF4_DROMD
MCAVLISANGLLHAIAQFASAAIYEQKGSVYVLSLAHGYHGVGGTSLDYAYDIGLLLRAARNSLGG